LIDPKEFGAESSLKDKGSLIFEHYCDNKFKANIGAVKLITANIETESYAKLTYEIVGTSELRILQNNLEKISAKYSKVYTDVKVKGVYLCTGYHVKRLSCIKYKKIAAGTAANTPFINVKGEFYSEDKTAINSWEVHKQLLDLSLFFIPIKKDSVSAEIVSSLPSGETIFQTLKYNTQYKLTDEDIITITNFPRLLQGDSLTQLMKKRNIILTNEQKNKLEDIGNYLNSLKKSSGVQFNR